MNKNLLLEQIKDFQGQLNSELDAVPKNQPDTYAMYYEIVENNRRKYLLEHKYRVFSNSDPSGKVLGRDIGLLAAIFKGYKKRQSEEPNVLEMVLEGYGDDAVSLVDEPEVLNVLCNPYVELTKGLHAAIAAHPKTPPEAQKTIALTGGDPGAKSHRFPLEVLSRREDLCLEAAILCAQNYYSRKMMVGVSYRNFDLLCLRNVVDHFDKKEDPMPLDELVELYKDIRTYDILSNLVAFVQHSYVNGRDLNKEKKVFFESLSPLDHQLFEAYGPSFANLDEIQEKIHKMDSKARVFLEGLIPYKDRDQGSRRTSPEVMLY